MASVGAPAAARDVVLGPFANSNNAGGPVGRAVCVLVLYNN